MQIPIDYFICNTCLKKVSLKRYLFKIFNLTVFVIFLIFVKVYTKLYFNNRQMNHIMKKLLLLSLTLILATVTINANNLRITGVTQVSETEISFTVSWENSWEVIGKPSNHDAVWLFIKYRQCGVGPWSHALLDTVMANHSLSTGIVAAMPVSKTDRFGQLPAGADLTNGLGHNTGIMIKRSSIGKGHISGQVCTLKVVKDAGVPFENGIDYEIKVIGIEMVYVPEEPYMLGDGKQNTYSFDDIMITSEDAVTVVGGPYTTNIPANFPKGYGDFYCMKYEITEGQYYELILTTHNMSLSTTPVANYGSYRNNLSATGTITPDRAQNYLGWASFTKYLDWACLRPMTELEYEKACKGPDLFPLHGYAWGTTDIVELTHVSGPEDGTETAVEIGANCNYNNHNILMNVSDQSQGSGPVGAGVFARNSNETRVTTGATYYGIMEMGGNVAELCVNVMYDPTYTGIWRDGYLSNGNSTVGEWTASYYMVKGGGYSNGTAQIRVCDRNYLWQSSSVVHWLGGRGVR